MVSVTPTARALGVNEITVARDLGKKRTATYVADHEKSRGDNPENATYVAPPAPLDIEVEIAEAVGMSHDVVNGVSRQIADFQIAVIPEAFAELRAGDDARARTGFPQRGIFPHVQ